MCDELEALLVDLTDDAGEPAAVGQHGPHQAGDVAVLGGEAGGVEEGLAGGGVAGAALRLARGR